MRIVTPVEIEQVAWEGYLEPVGEVYRSAALPKVTLGEPVSWTPDALQAQIGQAWSPPAGGQRYTLVRLACTLHPTADRSPYADATLTTYWRPAGSSGQAVAHAMYPERETAERTGTFGVRLGPDLKFGPVDVSVAEASVDIDMRTVYPVIQAFGLGEPKAYWKFERHKTKPLLGVQYVYAVVAAPPQASAVRLTVELVATVDTGWVPMRFKTPEQAEARISRSLPLSQKGPEPVVVPGREPNIAVVRKLMEEAFSPETLSRFCQERPKFQPLRVRFSPADGLDDMVDRVIDYCREGYLWDDLLAEVKAAHPQQFEWFEAQLWG